MKNTIKNKKLCTITIIIITFSMLTLSCNKDAGAIVILMEKNKKGVNYKIGSRNFDAEKLYDYLSESIIKNRDKNSAILVTHEILSIADIVNTRGVLQKIGFQKIRFFYYDDNQRMMAEYSFGKAAKPYSVDPKSF